jgi:thymidylate kinase
MDRPLDRMESQGDEYRERLRAGFLHEAGRCDRTHVIKADQPIEAVHTDIWQIATKVLGIAV